MAKRQETLLKTFFSFRGRINWSAYWLYNLIFFIVLSIGIAIDIEFTGKSQRVFSTIASFLILWPILAVNVKRCHDRNRGWSFALVPLIPILGTLWYFVDIGLFPGSKGINRFGPNPLDPSNDDTLGLVVPLVSGFLDVALILLPFVIVFTLIFAMLNAASYGSY